MAPVEMTLWGEGGGMRAVIECHAVSRLFLRGTLGRMGMRANAAEEGRVRGSVRRWARCNVTARR